MRLPQWLPDGISRRLSTPLGRSAASLYAIHVAGYILPVIYFPYLLRVFGVAAFGLYAFVVAVARYGLLVTDWGFAYTATRDLAQEIDAGEPLDTTTSAVFGGRALLLAGCAAGLAVLTLAVPPFSDRPGLYWVAFVGVAGSAFLPVWLFQACERLPVVAGIQLASRVVSTVLIFVLVSSGADVATAIWLWSLPWAVSAIVAIAVAYRLLGVRLVPTPVGEWWAAVRSGAAVFVSLAAASLYTVSNVILLGLITDTVQVGYFAAAEALVIAAVGLLGPVSQVLFPRSAQAAEQGRGAVVRHARRLAPIFVGLGALLSLVLFLGGPVLGPLFFGPGFGESVRLLQIMSPIPLAIAFATVLGPQLLLALRLDGRYASVIVSTALFNVVLTLALVPLFQATGTSLSALIAETLIPVGLLITCARSGLDPVRGRVRRAGVWQPA